MQTKFVLGRRPKPIKSALAIALDAAGHGHCWFCGRWFKNVAAHTSFCKLPKRLPAGAPPAPVPDPAGVCRLCGQWFKNVDVHIINCEPVDRPKGAHE